MSAGDRLSLARWEADRHAAVLSDALGRWDAAGAPALLQVEADPALRQLADQLLFRFIKLQDAMGERLVAGTLESLAEPYEDRPMRDRLDRLEQLGYLDVDRWLGWRALRNRLAHEYPEDADKREAGFSATVQAARELVVAYRAWVAKLSAG